MSPPADPTRQGGPVPNPQPPRVRRKGPPGGPKWRMRGGSGLEAGEFGFERAEPNRTKVERERMPCLQIEGVTVAGFGVVTGA